MATPLPDLVVYGRPGCHLCEAAVALAGALLDERRRLGLPAPALVERDIEADPDLHRAYLELIPVVELGDRRLELATSGAKLRRFLVEALDGAKAEAPTGVPMEAPARVPSR